MFIKKNERKKVQYQQDASLTKPSNSNTNNNETKKKAATIF